MFSAIVYKEDNICTFMFALCYISALLKRNLDLLYKKSKCSEGV